MRPSNLLSLFALFRTVLHGCSQPHQLPTRGLSQAFSFFHLGMFFSSFLISKSIKPRKIWLEDFAVTQWAALPEETGVTLGSPRSGY